VTSVLEHVSDERQARFGETLTNLKTEDVDSGNYEAFIDRVDGILDQVDEIITSEQEERQELLERRERIRNREGEKELQLLREDGLAPAALEEVERELRRVNRKLEDWYAYRSDLQKVKAAQLEDAIAELDTPKERLERVEETVDELKEDVDTRISEFRQEVKDERQSFREEVRARMDRDWQLVTDVLQRAIDAMQRLGMDVSELEQRVGSQQAAWTDEHRDEPVYRFRQGDWQERQDTLRQMVEEEDVADMSQAEIAALTDMDETELFDEEDGVVPVIEDKFGDQYPELR